MSSSPSYAVWALIGAMALALWAVSLTSAGKRFVVRPKVVLARWLRLLLLAGWAWLGWHLFAR